MYIPIFPIRHEFQKLFDEIPPPPPARHQNNLAPARACKNTCKPTLPPLANSDPLSVFFMVAVRGDDEAPWFFAIGCRGKSVAGSLLGARLP